MGGEHQQGRGARLHDVLCVTPTTSIKTCLHKQHAELHVQGLCRHTAPTCDGNHGNQLSRHSQTKMRTFFLGSGLALGFSLSCLATPSWPTLLRPHAATSPDLVITNVEYAPAGKEGASRYNS